MRHKPGHCKTWALLTFVNTDTAERALTARVVVEAEAEDGTTEEVVLRTKSAELEQQLSKSTETSGSLAAVLQQHGNTTASAVSPPRLVEAEAVAAAAGDVEVHPLPPSSLPLAG